MFAIAFFLSLLRVSKYKLPRNQIKFKQSTINLVAIGNWDDTFIVFQGKDLFMDLDSQHLTLIDPQDLSLLNVQPIQSIRVWGVGRDNGRYVYTPGRAGAGGV